MPNYRGISDPRPFGPCPALQQAHVLLWLKYGPHLGALDTPQIRFLVRSMALFRIFLYRPRPDGSGGGRASIQENPPGSWVLSGTARKLWIRQGLPPVRARYKDRTGPEIDSFGPFWSLLGF